MTVELGERAGGMKRGCMLGCTIMALLLCVVGAESSLEKHAFSTFLSKEYSEVAGSLRRTGAVGSRLCLRGGSAGYYQGIDEEPVILNKKKAPRPAGDPNRPRPPKEDAPLAKVSHDLKKAIMQARQAKKMTQKDLAKALNESPQTIQWYETGKIVPNNALIARMEKVLGAKLPRVKKEKVKADAP